MNNPFKEFLEQIDETEDISMGTETAKQIMLLGGMAALNLPRELIKFSVLLFKYGCPADAFLDAAKELTQEMKKEESDHE